MIDERKWPQYGFLRRQGDVLGICIHETGNTEMNAERLFKYLNEESKTSQGCHYLVDDTQTLQVMPDDWAVYHTGKGKDWGNRYTIAIEICSSLSDEKYQAAEDRAVELIEQLKKTYSITNENVFFHQDFNSKAYCPKTILDNYGTSKNFAYNRLED